MQLSPLLCSWLLLSPRTTFDCPVSPTRQSGVCIGCAHVSFGPTLAEATALPLSPESRVVSSVLDGSTLAEPNAVASVGGAIYVADTGHHCIRRVLVGGPKTQVESIVAGYATPNPEDRSTVTVSLACADSRLQAVHDSSRCHVMFFKSNYQLMATLRHAGFVGKRDLLNPGSLIDRGALLSTNNADCSTSSRIVGQCESLTSALARRGLSRSACTQCRTMFRSVACLVAVTV